MENSEMEIKRLKSKIIFTDMGNHIDKLANIEL